MSGTAKPATGLDTGVEVSSIINNYSMYDPAEFMFNQYTGSDQPANHAPFVGTYVRSSYSLGSWFNTRSDWFDLTINGTENVNIWAYKVHSGTTYQLKLAAYENPGGVKGDLVTLSETIPNEIGWYKLFSNLPAGRYRFEKDPAITSTYHVDTEWYIEEAGEPLVNKFLIQDGSNIYGRGNPNLTNTSYIIYSSSRGGWEGPYDRLMTGSSDTIWSSAVSGGTGWLGVDFGAGNEKVVQAYQIAGYYSTDRGTPRDFTFEGSNDGTNWDVLDTVTGESGYVAYTFKNFSFVNSTPYRYYRLNVTASNLVATTYLTISELAMYQFSSGLDQNSYLENDTFKLLGTTPVTEAMFTGNGFEDIANIPMSEISGMTTVKLLAHKVV